MEVMSAICPLGDDYLPIDAGSLKSKQVFKRLSICWHSFRRCHDSSQQQEDDTHDAQLTACF